MVFVFWSPFQVNNNLQLDAMTAAALRKEAAGLQLAHFASPCSPMRSAPPRLCQRRAAPRRRPASPLLSAELHPPASFAAAALSPHNSSQEEQPCDPVNLPATLL